LVISGTSGANGWYKTASVSTNGADTISGLASSRVAVDGGAWQAFATLSEGIHSVVGRASDNAGNVTTTSTQIVKVDGTAPDISASVTAGTLATGWYVTDVTLTASASDATSGLALVEYRLDGGAWSPGDSLTIASEGPHTVDFRATDQAGLRSTVSLNVKVDKTPPSISFDPSGTSGANNWYISTVSLQVNAADALSGVASTEYRLDGGSWAFGSSLTLGDGEHTVGTRARDNAGNLTVDSQTKTINIKVDTAVPSLNTSLSGKSGQDDWYVSDVTFSAHASDLTSGLAQIEYRLDGGAWLPGDSLTVSAEGFHTVDFRATDQAGLHTTDSLSVKIDKMPPSITFNPSGTLGSNGWYTSPVSLAVNVADVPSGVAEIETRLDGGSWISGNSLTLGDGAHTVEARATDKAGNLSAVSAAETIGIQVDTTAPVLVASLSGKLGLAGWYVSDVTTSAQVSDATSGIALTEYRLDGGSWGPGTSITASADGPHTVDFRTTDRAGNQAFASRTFKIDQTFPASGFVSPIEGSSGTIAQGLFTLNGHSTDAMSGLAAVQISTDGITWLSLPISSSGEWRYAWDTKPLPNDLYPVLVRAQDLAGNFGRPARVTLLLANQPPKVNVQESWWIWEVGSLSVRKRFLPVTEIRVRIACLDGQPDVKLNFTPENLPATFSWDRKCGQGQFATSGDHIITLTACDRIGNCASAQGTIRVPFIALPVPTWTPTVEPAQTSTPEPNDWPTVGPTAQAFVTALPTLVPISTQAPIHAPSQPDWFSWLLAVILAGVLALATAAVLDPRPRALCRLGETLARLCVETDEELISDDRI